MKENTRSITAKNWLGGFFGGVLGLIAFEFLYPAFLPLGVVVGVLFGWWYEAIWKLIVKNVSDGIKFYQDCLSDLRSFIGECVQSSLWGLWRKRTKNDDSRLLPPALYNWFLVPATWLVTRPVTCVKWFNRHPMNRAYVLRGLLISMEVICIIAAVAYAVWYFMPENFAGFIGTNGKMIPPRPPTRVDYVGFTIMGSLIAVLIPISQFCGCFGNRTFSDFYEDFERYCSGGPVKYLFHHMLKMLKEQAMLLALMFLSIVYFSGAAALFLTLLIVPCTIFIWTIKGINEIVMRKGHWLCLGVTMTVTIAVAYFFNAYFANRYLFGAAMLSAGMLSGALTEGIRWSIAWLFKNTNAGRRYDEIEIGEFLKEKIFPRWGMTYKTWEKIIGDPLAIN